MTVPNRLELAGASQQVGVAAAALTRWYTQQDSDTGNPVPLRHGRTDRW